MHHYDFPGGGGSPALLSYEAFDDMLAWLVEQVDVHVVTLGVVADSLRDKDSSHWIRHRQWREHLPWRFKHFLPELCIATRSHLRSLL
jgi:hypothetical protein